MSHVIIIPAFKPSEDLPAYCIELKNLENLFKIIIVNDGSPDSFNRIFDRCSQVDKVDLIHFQHNRGKGAAIKAAVERAIQYDKKEKIVSIITVDSDGQHNLNDVTKLSNEALINPNSLILGVRKFDGEVPLKSKIGNYLTAKILRVFFELKTAGDSQTGLRAIPMNLSKKIIEAKGQKYEFETEMLLIARNQNIDILNIPIDTIYIDNNKLSSFRPFKDSLRIYLVLLKYGLSSMIAILCEFLIFVSFNMYSDLNPLYSNIISRASSIFIHYQLIKILPFRGRQISDYGSFKYVMLAISNSIVVGIFLNYQQESANLILIKAFFDSLLFLINFLIINFFIFKK